MSNLKQRVMEAAKKLEAQQLQYQGLGMMNQPIDYMEQVESQARLRIAADKHWVARTEYEKVFEEWAKAGFPE